MCRTCYQTYSPTILAFRSISMEICFSRVARILEDLNTDNKTPTEAMLSLSSKTTNFSTKTRTTMNTETSMGRKSQMLTRMACRCNHRKRLRTSLMRYLLSSMRKLRRVLTHRRRKTRTRTLVPFVWTVSSRVRW